MYKMPFVNVEPIRLWCQRILPAVYGDEISYYEAICKLNSSVNDLIANDIEFKKALESVIDGISSIEAFRIYGNVAEMKADVTLTEKSVPMTLGYYSPGDGGSALYKVSGTGTANDIDVLHLATGLFAELVVENESTSRQYGAVGDGIADDTERLTLFLNNKSAVKTFVYGTYNVYGLTCPNMVDCTVNGNFSTLNNIHVDYKQERSYAKAFMLCNDENAKVNPENNGSIIIRDLVFEGNSSSFVNYQNMYPDAAQMINLTMYDNVLIDNCTFNNSFMGAIQTWGCRKVKVVDCTFDNIGFDQSQTSSYVRNALSSIASCYAAKSNPNFFYVDCDSLEFAGNNVSITDIAASVRGYKLIDVSGNVCSNIGHVLEYFPGWGNKSATVVNVINNYCNGFYSFYWNSETLPEAHVEVNVSDCHGVNQNGSAVVSSYFSSSADCTVNVRNVTSVSGSKVRGTYFPSLNAVRCSNLYLDNVKVTRTHGTEWGVNASYTNLVMKNSSVSLSTGIQGVICTGKTVRMEDCKISLGGTGTTLNFAMVMGSSSSILDYIAVKNVNVTCDCALSSVFNVYAALAAFNEVVVKNAKANGGILFNNVQNIIVKNSDIVAKTRGVQMLNGFDVSEISECSIVAEHPVQFQGTTNCSRLTIADNVMNGTSILRGDTTGATAKILNLSRNIEIPGKLTDGYTITAVESITLNNIFA